MKRLIIKIKIFLLKLDFSEINDELAAHYFRLVMRGESQKNKEIVECELLQYRKRKFEERRKIAIKISELRKDYR